MSGPPHASAAVVNSSQQMERDSEAGIANSSGNRKRRGGRDCNRCPSVFSLLTRVCVSDGPFEVGASSLRQMEKRIVDLEKALSESRQRELTSSLNQQSSEESLAATSVRMAGKRRRIRWELFVIIM